MAQLLVVAHAVAVLLLCGLTWTVALVVYPSFAEAGSSMTELAWQRFHAAHARRMTWAVGPIWAVEGITDAGLLIARPAAVGLPLILIAAASGAATVALTVWRAVPLHQRLAPGFDPGVLRQLQLAHLWRSMAWAVAAAAGLAMALLL